MKHATSIILAFALLSFTALGAYLAADFWLPALVVGAVVTVAAVLLRRQEE
jgi:Flp pilus assembly protein protease CpaA